MGETSGWQIVAREGEGVYKTKQHSEKQKTKTNKRVACCAAQKKTKNEKQNEKIGKQQKNENVKKQENQSWFSNFSGQHRQQKKKIKKK